MTQEAIIYGYIQGAEWMSSDFHKLHRLNGQVIAALPESDTFPYLTRGLFAIPGEEPAQGTYRSQIIHFGGSFMGLEREWRKWLEKFEALLRRMYWFNAVLILRGEIIGEQQYEWTVDAGQIVHYLEDPPHPAAKWFFDGGPRQFDL